MKKLMTRWNIEKPWQLIIILLVFSITGSSSVLVGRPFLSFIGISLDNLNPLVYYPIFIILSFVFYQIFLILYGWLFGQFQFFWTMEKRMLNRFGIKI